MLWTIVLILAALWVIGMLVKKTLGGLLHVLLVVAAIVLVVNLVGGRSGG